MSPVSNQLRTLNPSALQMLKKLSRPLPSNFYKPTSIRNSCDKVLVSVSWRVRLQVSRDTLTGELISKKTIIILMPIGPHRKWGLMFGLFLFSIRPPESLVFWVNRPNVQPKMYNPATKPPWSFGYHTNSMHQMEKGTNVPNSMGISTQCPHPNITFSSTSGFHHKHICTYAAECRNMNRRSNTTTPSHHPRPTRFRIPTVPV